MRKFFILSIFAILTANIFANNGDTVVIQTFTFDAGRNGNKVGTFQFPDGSKTCSKVLMYYTVKCDPTGTYSISDNKDFPCGEWDFDVFTYVLFPTDSVDSVLNLRDTTFVENEIEHKIDTILNYDTIVNPVFDHWKINTYITPYGINLDKDIDILNKEGWTYVFDVTDFLPILKNEVMLKDNNGQELVDIRFAFIEGTPVRQVLNIQKVWDSKGYSEPNYWEGYPLKNFDKIVRDTTFALKENEKQVKLRTTVSGHMMNGNNSAAEFSKNIHTVKAGGQVIKSWNILQSCADNAMYPQGGTWILPRAGWCPGLPATTQEFDLTPYISNSSVTFDYDVQTDNNGVYRITSYLVTYGDILQKDDVEAETIIAPTDDPNQRRFNPSASKPLVVIKNIGKNPLRTVEIKYGLRGISENFFVWNGNLGFEQKDTVQLSVMPMWNKVESKQAEFYLELSNPNSKTDPTPYNNSISAVCTKPVIFEQNEIIFLFKTNKKPKETSWKLINFLGETIAEIDADTLKASKNYLNEWTLQNGNYSLQIYDKGNDGLSYWNNSAGNGSAILQYYGDDGKLKKLHTFDGDFGTFIKLDFAINSFAGIGEKWQKPEQIPVFPNPAKDMVYVDLANFDGENMKIQVLNLMGGIIAEQSVSRFNINTVSVANFSAGVYSLSLIKDNAQMAQGKFIIMK